MKMKRFLVAWMVAAVTITKAIGAACPNGGFVGGLSLSGAMTKTVVKVKGPGETAITGNKSAATQKKRFKIEILGAAGYAWRVNDSMITIEIRGGIQPGTTSFAYNGWRPDSTTAHDPALDIDTLQVKNKWFVGLAPQFGYLVTPNVELYIVAGVMFAGYKLTYADTTTDSDSDKASSTSRSSVSVTPMAGGGIRVYLLDHRMSIGLEGTARMKANHKLMADLAKESNSSDTAVKEGGNAKSVKTTVCVMSFNLRVYI
ncbi:MAG: hypothetical protein LBF56_01305 [Holosporales bacterium]|jgi:opacity protein-like surface antigen|nr:hypothetical protein [Holosporales bacterium]